MAEPAPTPISFDQARAWFPVSHRLTYLNHAAISPLATPTRQAMEDFMRESEHYGALHWQAWLERVAHARAAAGALIGAPKDEIALLKNTTEGLNAVALGLDWRPGDRVLVFECEFPANLYPWLALRERGVKVELLPQGALTDPDRLRDACRNARLLSLSFVQYLNGYRSDLETVGAICRETDTLFVVDAIQGLGAFPVSVKRAGIHALAADAHKWLTGPEGAALLYLDPVLCSQLRPAEAGWLSVAAADDFSAAAHSAATGEDLVFRPGAARFECGSHNTLGLVGLTAAIELLRSFGVERIAHHLLALGSSLQQGLEHLGCQVLQLSASDRHRSGIYSFRHPDQLADSIVAGLGAEGIVVSARQGWVRVSPHFYNNSNDIEHLLGAVEGLLQS